MATTKKITYAEAGLYTPKKKMTYAEAGLYTPKKKMTYAEAGFYKPEKKMTYAEAGLYKPSDTISYAPTPSYASIGAYTPTDNEENASAYMPQQTKSRPTYASIGAYKPQELKLRYPLYASIGAYNPPPNIQAAIERDKKKQAAETQPSVMYSSSPFNATATNTSEKQQTYQSPLSLKTTDDMVNVADTIQQKPTVSKETAPQKPTVSTGETTKKPMTFEEFFAAQRKNAQNTYNDSLRSNDKVYRESVLAADTAYRQNLATYGNNAEKMAQMGLQGGGYGEYVSQSAYAGKAANIAAAAKTKQDADTAAQKNYSDTMQNIDNNQFSYIQGNFESGIAAAREGTLASDEVEDFCAANGITSEVQIKLMKVAAERYEVNSEYDAWYADTSWTGAELDDAYQNGWFGNPDTPAAKERYRKLKARKETSGLTNFSYILQNIGNYTQEHIEQLYNEEYFGALDRDNPDNTENGAYKRYNLLLGARKKYESENGITTGGGIALGDGTEAPTVSEAEIANAIFEENGDNGEILGYYIADTSGNTYEAADYMLECVKNGTITSAFFDKKINELYIDKTDMTEETYAKYKNSDIWDYLSETTKSKIESLYRAYDIKTNNKRNEVVADIKKGEFETLVATNVVDQATASAIQTAFSNMGIKISFGAGALLADKDKFQALFGISDADNDVLNYARYIGTADGTDDLKGISIGKRDYGVNFTSKQIAALYKLIKNEGAINISDYVDDDGNISDDLSIFGTFDGSDNPASDQSVYLKAILTDAKNGNISDGDLVQFNYGKSTNDRVYFEYDSETDTFKYHGRKTGGKTVYLPSGYKITNKKGKVELG